MVTALLLVPLLAAASIALTRRRRIPEVVHILAALSFVAIGLATALKVWRRNSTPTIVEGLGGSVCISEWMLCLL
ncbi:MAG: hypothetical protein ACREDR_44295 [Blastocatellia bacterium]